MFEPLLIHNNNTVLIDHIQNKLSLKLDQFDFENSDLDTYISRIIIPLLKEKKFNILFIKDNLSQNYIELYGILLAYHIRLSSELEDKRFIPIIIISELDGYILNKIEPMSNILFTKNVFIGNNDLATYNYYKDVFETLTPFTNFKKEFLELIKIEPPKDYLSHHSITNEWAIYRWGQVLKTDSEVAVSKNKEKISSMLYFKYLKVIYPIFKEGETEQVLIPTAEGKILYIDDEWDKGWNDNLNHIFSLNSNIDFKTFEYDYKDKSEDTLLIKIQNTVKNEEFSPDVVILDLRLSENDHLDDISINSFLGIDVLKSIHEINAGIQVIMLTATSKSTILEELYNQKILGYIKKEHPNEISISIVENINKFIKLIDTGLERSYLKDVFITRDSILNILKDDPFKRYISNIDKYKDYLLLLDKGCRYIFDILDSDVENKFNYAMISITTSLEAIVKIFLFQKSRDDYLFFWDGEEAKGIYENSRLEDKLKKILNKKLGSKIEIELEALIKHRNNYVHSNNKYKEVTNENIIEWFCTLKQVIEIIKDSNYTPYLPKKEKLLAEKKPIITKSGFRKKV